MRFEWDEDNEEHVARHGVDIEEWEAAYNDLNKKARPAHSGPERRRALLGRTDSGRLLHLVFTLRGKVVRPVTARDATFRERRMYREK